MTYAEEIARKIADTWHKIEELKYKIQTLEEQEAADSKLLELLSDKAWSTKTISGDLNGNAIFGFAFDHLYLQRSSSISREFIVTKLSECCGYNFNSRSRVHWGLILGEIEKRFDNDPSISREYKNNKEFIKGICYR
jgi:hypothetical protein